MGERCQGSHVYTRARPRPRRYSSGGAQVDVLFNTRAEHSAGREGRCSADRNAGDERG